MGEELREGGGIQGGGWARRGEGRVEGFKVDGG